MLILFLSAAYAEMEAAKNVVVQNAQQCPTVVQEIVFGLTHNVSQNILLLQDQWPELERDHEVHKVSAQHILHTNPGLMPIFKLKMCI